MNHEQAEHVIALLSQILDELKPIRTFLINRKKDYQCSNGSQRDFSLDF